MADISESTVFIAVGMFVLPRAIDAIIGAFKFSAKRNVDNEDKAKEKAENEFHQLRDKVDKLDRDMVSLTASHASHKDLMNSALGSIDGRLIALDNRVALAGKSSEEKITEGFKKLEIELNRKLAQVVAPRGRSR